MSGHEPLARVLSDYRRTVTDTEAVKVPDFMQATSILADPTPLLEALAAAGVLTEQREKGFEWSPNSAARWVPVHRYVTAWTKTDPKENPND